MGKGEGEPLQQVLFEIWRRGEKRESCERERLEESYYGDKTAFAEQV